MGFTNDLPKIGIKELSRKSYENDCPYLLPGPYYNQSGRGFNQLISIMMPYSKNALAALLLLLIGGVSSKKDVQYGGYGKLLFGHFNKNMLLVLASLLLLHYISKNKLTKNLKESIGKIMKGGEIDDIDKMLSSNVKHFSADKLKKSLFEIVKDGGNIRSVSKTQSGGNNLVMILRQTLSTLRVDNMLIALGLSFLADQTRKSKKGGYIKPGPEYDVVGQPTLTYSHNKSQFGCVLPEWGYIFGSSTKSNCI